MPPAPLQMTAAEIEALLATAYPQAVRLCTIDLVEPGRVMCRSATSADDLRPGGTISGPTMMALVDLAAYVLTLATIGPATDAVTSHLSIHFLRRPPPGELLVTARTLRRTRHQLVSAAEVCATAQPDNLVAHATTTYALPPPG